ncbi:DUF4383 domain-containing protein [Streptomyces europaeiscabiei]|uniref:DUF4383 domain-containing protein n=1 Tax=Streptomyces europaeiscabiei TaxID=146819 RepID=A0ABU4NA66_9ACTN|nr:DUF4383 domain-containing protein [Streptomyces europaeiscabiei]MDX2524012.1 DUF4383 domain-containing protein [Streptomyces europaeiscabiei]MDX2763158.1 DUF4383 domain-containing protein [Streptomyces europaeiscabiei]MDX2772940.1 DUF4383 domain-containing protein [Streptomyces europaeiscabiei]MDX3545286.1 DUF4383 domain-containing protein [Streptomyces europaeiscabiei]MDX3554277.1 DUF4383 domain-containing protein [Streptomyces europaeiscabiei]
MATHATHTVRPKGRHAGPRRRIRIDEHLPVDHRLNRVYRFGAGLMGLFLLAFGILGLIDKVGWFDTNGDEVVGLNTNGTLSVLSIAVGLLLLVGMVIGGNFASTLNMTLGVLFILSGFANMALLDTDSNFLAFRIQNVLFSFVVGLLLMTFGMYGRVGAALPHDNPYWRARHPRESEREMRRKAAVGMAKLERADALPEPESGSESGSDGKGAG